MKKNLLPRLLSLLLVLALCTGMLPYAAAVSGNETGNLTFQKVDNDQVTADWRTEVELPQESDAPYADTEYVRVSILLEQASAVEAGYELQSVATNEEALAYRSNLRDAQN